MGALPSSESLLILKVLRLPLVVDIDTSTISIAITITITSIFINSNNSTISIAISIIIISIIIIIIISSSSSNMISIATIVIACEMHWRVRVSQMRTRSASLHEAATLLHEAQQVILIADLIDSLYAKQSVNEARKAPLRMKLMVLANCLFGLTFGPSLRPIFVNICLINVFNCILTNQSARLRGVPKEKCP